MYQAIFNDDLQLLKDMLDSGEDIDQELNIKDTRGDKILENHPTPISFACYLGRFKIVKLLLDRGADVYKTDGKVYFGFNLEFLLDS